MNIRIEKVMTQDIKKCPHVVHFNVPRDWLETTSRHQKRYYEDGKNVCGWPGLLGRVILTSFDWLTGLSVSFVMDQSDYFRFAFTTLN